MSDAFIDAITSKTDTESENSSSSTNSATESRRNLTVPKLKEKYNKLIE